jgi:hypothetical protein
VKAGGKPIARLGVIWGSRGSGGGAVEYVLLVLPGVVGVVWGVRWVRVRRVERARLARIRERIGEWLVEGWVGEPAEPESPAPPVEVLPPLSPGDGFRWFGSGGYRWGCSA